MTKIKKDFTIDSERENHERDDDEYHGGNVGWDGGCGGLTGCASRDTVNHVAVEIGNRADQGRAQQQQQHRSPFACV